MTYEEALELGYRWGDRRYSRGYVSRRANPIYNPVKRAGKRGTRAGQLYVDLPNYHSTRYHIRQYLVWAGDGPEPEWEEVK